MLPVYLYPLYSSSHLTWGSNDGWTKWGGEHVSNVRQKNAQRTLGRKPEERTTWKTEVQRGGQYIFIKKNPTRCNNVSKFYYSIFT
jgi:hypothetical protein